MTTTNLSVRLRLRRKAVYEDSFGALSLCIAGLLVMPAFLLNPSPLFRAAQFICFWFLAWLSGKKNNPLITLAVILGIVICNLFVPYGPVLFSLGVFKISAGALMTGIQRAVTLEGLIMLSRVCIRPDLKIPGTFGDLIAESFRIFARITDSKQRISAKNFVRDIDVLMLELSAEETPAEVQEQNKKTKAAGFFVIAIVIVFSYVLSVLGWCYWL